MTLPRIQKLPESLQNHIAAGEVVERPASVLKELLDNALDADATRVDVMVEGGGQSCIQVRDNGHGILPEDLPLALTRHATSKLHSLEDLTAIRTLGFRGEALASVASVSRLRLASSTGGGEGVAVEAEFGRLGAPRPLAMAQGTEVTVRDLFANVPARLKFLRTPTTESRKCQEVFQRISLLHLDVSLSFSQAGRTVFSLPATASLAERLRHFWPEEIVDAMLPVESRGSIEVVGLAGDPARAQGRGDRILLAVNGRPVQDKLLVRAVREAYRGMILGNEFPQVVLDIRLDPEMVDVNVHPAKIEVRFQDESMVFRAVMQALSRVLQKNLRREEPPALTPPADISLSAPMDPPTPKFAQTRLMEHLAVAAEAPALWDPPAPQAPPPPSRTSIHLPWRYAGQVAATYLVLLGADEVLLLDQHAAHERVLFHSIATTPPSSQGIMPPITFPVHPSEVDTVEALWEPLTTLGFALEHTPPRLVVHRIPAILTVSRAKDFIADALQGKERDLHSVHARMACHGAVRAGDELSPTEAHALLEAWWNTPEREFCPHGRPTLVRLGVEALEKLFKRRG
ncbi:MAG: mismatch repair protein MutL [Desulfomicrobiaceae bacterium]|jgi:DNA mismatch repair protein MutL|nr:mismatch repair protein MutL [Desulfomicrobiaceae bacterium]